MTKEHIRSATFAMVAGAFPLWAWGYFTGYAARKVLETPSAITQCQNPSYIDMASAIREIHFKNPCDGGSK